MAAGPSAAAGAPGGADEKPVPVRMVTLGSLTWSFYDPAAVNAYPGESAQVADSMRETLNYYNTVAAYSGNVPVTVVNWGITAQASWNGSIQFGYMRNARTAQHETAHFMGMTPYAGANNKPSWSSQCDAGWRNTAAQTRMSRFSPGAGIGCSSSNGHFWGYGLNYDSEYDWLSKGRNIAMVGAMRSDIGLSDGSKLPDTQYRVVSRSSGVPIADKNLAEGGFAVEVRSTVSSRQAWMISFDGGFIRFKNMASNRYLTGSHMSGWARLVSTEFPGPANTWEMVPTTDGYFMLRNESSYAKCLRAVGDGGALQVADCDGGGNPDASLQFHLAEVANLAYRRPATASSTWSADYEPGRANDNDGATGWSAAGNDSAPWWQVDLGEARQITQVSVLARQDGDQPETRTAFEVRASNTPDFANYKVLAKVDPGTTIPNRGSFTRDVSDPGVYRYVRVAKTDGRYFFIADVAVAGVTNLAYQRPATASSTWSAGYEPGRANDGDGASGWSAAGNDRAAWWQVDLGQAQQIDRVTVLMRQDVDQPETRTGFEVRASNTPDFSRYSVLTQVEPGATIPHRGAFTGEVYDRGAYRYIRIAKTDGRYFFFSDVTIVGRP